VYRGCIYIGENSDLEACNTTVVFAEENAEGNDFGTEKNIYL